ncbi:hypothetical protein BOX15_Mlig028456g1 [Macrostomum lignano]|uniref:Protein-serine O-palmitoleoyltransferase porcupine n=1 Tax=Macrostomum lignano TaxID=282301 RepID=A0A267FPF5_9PLAT|nr:hypothetical protein BOX15_Mlig028456g1 [Macrostomum lignano]
MSGAGGGGGGSGDQLLDEQLAALLNSEDEATAAAALMSAAAAGFGGSAAAAAAYSTSGVVGGAGYLVRRVSLTDLFNNCVRTALQQGLVFTLPIFIMCILFKVLCHTVGEGFEETGISFLPRQIIHVSSGCLGLVILHHLFQEFTMLVLLQGLLAYITILLAHTFLSRRCGLATALLSLIFHLICQVYLPADSWQKIRGPLMVLSLKVVSIGFDLDRQLLLLVPGVFEFFGYAFNVGTVVFGPWVAFLDYMTIIQIKDRPMNFSWLLTAIRAYVLSIGSLLYSTCFSNWIIIDGSYKWLIAFRDAQSFRFSHYFTCYTSEATAIASGIGASRYREAGNSETKWDLRVCKPLNVELPRSLVDVVTNWNLPMHRWLKQYVFNQSLHYGKFPAVLLTYIASSLLHGMNFQLSAVLLSIGVYSYIEYVLRQRLASIFNLCIESRPCSSAGGGGEGGSGQASNGSSAHQCMEHPGRQIAGRRLSNLLFTCLAIFHLSYLGLLFDTSPISEQGYSYQHTLSKWAELDYLSHLVAGASFAFYMLIR